MPHTWAPYPFQPFIERAAHEAQISRSTLSWSQLGPRSAAEALLRSSTLLPSPTLRFTSRRGAALENHRMKRCQLQRYDGRDRHAALQQLDPLWDELFPAEQVRIVALLVERVDIGTDGLNVRLRVDGLGGLAREMLSADMGAAA